MVKKKNNITDKPQPELLALEELKTLIQKGDTGLLFCFGTSFISRVIQSKTKEYDNELVPSHVAIIVDGKLLYESTSAPEKVGNKNIPAGVRRYLLKDFFKLEKTKQTKYYFYPVEIIMNKAEQYIHLPYGKDIIVDFLLKDGSDGDSKGLICSQYANLCTEILEDACPSPAVLFRKVFNNS